MKDIFSKNNMFKLQNIERDFEILKDVLEEREAKIYKERFTPFDLDDDEFCWRYRLDKNVTRFLINLLNIEEPKSNRGLPIAISLQVLTTLQFLGRNAHQVDVASLHGISQPSVGRVIKSISRKIALLRPHFINFPCNAELEVVKKKFYEIAGFPGVIGAISCVRVRIKRRSLKVFQEKAEFDVNTNSLNIQIVYDANLKITDITISQGLISDIAVWAECQLKKRLETSKSEHNGVLLGSVGYPLSQTLLTPVGNPSTPQEKRYNSSHERTMSKIECLNTQLKSKFCSMFDRLRVDLETAKNIIFSVAVLHNIAKEGNSTFVDEEKLNFNDISDIPIQTSTTEADESGNSYRTAFINENF